MLTRTALPLAVVASTVASAAFVQTPPQPPRAYASLAREVLAELIATNTTESHGTTAAARAIAARALAAGFSSDEVTVVVPPQDPNRASVVVRLRGRAHERPVLYICHLDVVEARPEDWSVDPFQLTERDGWLYGRGVIDMKGQDAAVLTSLIRLKQEGYVPPQDLIASFTPDEESRSEYGVGWLFKTHRPLVDAALVINPDGGEAAVKNGRRLYIGMQTSEKVYTTFELEATDKGGHSSRPTGDNPIYRLARSLAALEKLRFPLHLTETTKLYFSRRAALESGQLQSDMRAIVREPADPAAIERLSAAVETNIQLRTTCTATMIEGGHAENALPQRARAAVQCRIIPGESPDSIARTIAATVNDPGIGISIKTAGETAPESPPSASLLGIVERVTHAMWPGVIVLPDMSPGATDSVYTRALGIPSYGIDGLFDDIDDSRAHGKDERIGVAAFAEEVEFTYRLMREVADKSHDPDR